jgi:hypothetical protein
LVDLGEGMRPLPEMLATWDYATDLALERIIELDLASVRGGAGLKKDDPLALGVLWSSDNHLRGAGSVIRLEGDEPVTSVTLNFVLEGWDLGETLSLDTALYLPDDLGVTAARTAFRPGSRLWTQRKKVRLQGSAPRFPLALVDPVRFGFDDHTPWFLEIRGELDTPVLGGLHLLINENNPVVRTAVESPTRTPEADPIMSMLGYDVGRTLLEYALEQDDLGAGPYDEETLGHVLQALLERVFPGELPSQVRNRRKVDPAGFAADVAASLGLLSTVSA